MRITQWGEYGIHCASFIAEQEEKGQTAVPAALIAESQGIALDYTQQILQRLRKANIVQSVRGPQGGYRLARPAGEISLRDLLTAAEGDTFEVICETKPLSSARCSVGAQCNLRPLWFGLKNEVNAYLGRFTLEQIVKNTLPYHELPPTGDAPIQINTTRNSER